MTQHDDVLYLGHMFDAAQAVLRLTDGLDRDAFDRDEVLQLAVVHLLQNIGEASRNVSAARKASLPTVPWSEMGAMRNHLVHGYWKVNLNLVWRVVVDDLVPLIAAIEPALPSDRDNPHPTPGETKYDAEDR